MHNIEVPHPAQRTEALRHVGEELLCQGRVGAVVLAGGQGSRLNWTAPKGTFPISPLRKKSLFQLLTEKICAASKKYKNEAFAKVSTGLPLAIQTSKANDVETRAFFEEHNYFEHHNLSFFTQSERPLLNEDATPSSNFASDGNGSFFWTFQKSGLLDSWKKQGIDFVCVFVIDNPLLLPYDPYLIGLTALHGGVSLVGIERTHPEEPVGLIVEENKKIKVIEYCDLPSALKTSELPFLANISSFCFSMGFIETVAHMDQESFPIHLAKKFQKELNCSFLKQEFFIFDMLSVSSNSNLLFVPRADCFAPLKNATGQDSPKTCVETVMRYERKLFEQISHVSVPENHPIELAGSFYYPTKELIAQWRGKSLPEDGYAE